tara:strand:- start:738 stop:1202 length:465 start_codon:yes stop_codon:yes gene_type:complete
MREVLSTKEKREAIKRYIGLNSELSNRRIARYWDVGKDTVRRYRAQLSGSFEPQNTTKAAQMSHPETENLPVAVNANGQPYDEEKIKLCIQQTMKGIASIEKSLNYLQSFRTFQVADALMTDNQYIRNLNLYLDILEGALDFYKGVINERDSYL